MRDLSKLDPSGCLPELPGTLDPPRTALSDLRHPAPHPHRARGHAQQWGACLGKPPPLDRCIAALNYAYPWDLLIQLFKPHQALDLRRALLERLDQALVAAQALPVPEWLLPVPVSAQRLRERGYNQSWELARNLAGPSQLRFAPDMLLRVRDTRHQIAPPTEERAADVRHAFAIDPRRAPQLRGAHVTLLDDVMTTDATLHELARSLRQAGAASV